ncbi:MAG: hypothetical protein IPF79_02450 [Ignavibacteria bacterium]|nr:hypothetical protein [Ignavibacteria bacterium]
MHGLSMTHHFPIQDRYNKDALTVLREELLSGDIDRQRAAAACIRVGMDVRKIARHSDTQVAADLNGVVIQVDPDSPLLPDLTELLALADEIVPL